ncbi:hypothetical protein, partial [Nostoc commune]|uniref:hypothetical protein n=1 Tax=Nostoc commune TaxID=1178 RepID=UPI001E30BF90
SSTSNDVASGFRLFLAKFSHHYFATRSRLQDFYSSLVSFTTLANKNSDETSYLQENQIQPLSPQELFSQIRAEIEFYQSQIAILQQQLFAITGGSTNG